LSKEFKERLIRLVQEKVIGNGYITQRTSDIM